MTLRGSLFDGLHFTPCDVESELGQAWNDGPIQPWLKACGFEEYPDTDGEEFWADSLSENWYGEYRYWTREDGVTLVELCTSPDGPNEYVIARDSAASLELRLRLSQHIHVRGQALAVRELVSIMRRWFTHRFEHEHDRPCRDCETHSETLERLRHEKERRDRQVVAKETP